MKTLIVLCAFFSIFLFVYALLKRLFLSEDVLEKLRAYEIEAAIQQTYTFTKKSKRSNRFKGLFKQSDENKWLMAKANMQMTYEEFMMVRLAILLVTPFLTFLIRQDIVVSVVFTILALIGPKIYLNNRIKAHVKAFDRDLNDGVILIANALKAGYSFLQALAVAAQESQDPLAYQFKTLLKELSLGMALEDGLNNLMKRMPSEDLSLVVNAILIQKDVGGNLSEILSNISETIMDRQKIQNELKTLTAQGKLSGTIVLVLPFALGGFIYLFNPEYMSVLFTTNIGRIMLGLAFLGQFIGWLFIRKIIKIEM